MKVGFIGAGNMGAALAAAAAKSSAEIYVYDKDEKKAREVAASLGGIWATNRAIAEVCDFVFLGVKPNIVASAAEEIKDILAVKKNCTTVSMAAGVSLESLGEALGYDVPVIRIMPNTPASIGKGMILWTKNQAVSDKCAKSFLEMMKNAGSFDMIDEKLIDAASAVSGCGPAFVYMFIESLADGAVACGLPRDKALLYAAETLIGAAEMVKSSPKHPEELKDMVCSPGGSTIEGVRALEEGGLRAATANAVIAAYKKTVELGKK